MNEKDTPKPSTQAMYLWSIALMFIGFAPLFFIRYQRAHTFCGNGGCSGIDSAAKILQPFGAIAFLAGLGLLLVATGFVIARAVKKK